ncbi:hypothetical protein [Cupriavidus sp. BIS7]|uniref:hypothetical protein n=1 Tax=Cupriavidus sp. BIS7 TaxID=1217718 RepID=UPI0002E6385C|nr:hypothetical protein [Cupriavidus sp. BIS7]
MNTLTYTLITYRPDSAHQSAHDILVSRDWQEVVRYTATLLDQNAKRETEPPSSFYLLVDGQFAGVSTQERLIKAATNCPQPTGYDNPAIEEDGLTNRNQEARR